MKILVTGISGTLGSRLTPLLLAAGHQVIGFSRDEQKQRLIPPHEKLTLYLGDVRDRDRLIEATRGVELVYHLAALKCVDTLEANPEESFKTNLLGTDNVLHAQRVNHIPRVVFTSTDKAVYPINAYGKAKALAENLVLRNSNNVVCRYGNVLASRGSVVPLFVKNIKEGKPVQITDPRMTRFWMTQDEAADFVLSKTMCSGLFTPDIKSSSILNLAMAISEIIYGKEDSWEAEYVGIRPGEKIHECLATEKEAGKDIFSNDPSRLHSKASLIEAIAPMVGELI